MEMMRALHHSLSRPAFQLWLNWNRHLRLLLQLSSSPEGFEQSDAADEELLQQWDLMIRKSRSKWERYVGESVIATDQEPQEGDVTENLDGDPLAELLSQSSLSE